ncbi:MAG: hypothetical protein Q9160_006485 [Pyrenula sp. 1 TL-2023]
MINYVVQDEWKLVDAEFFEFVKQLSADPQNQIIGIIRSQKTVAALADLASARKNVHIVETDIGDPKRLQEAIGEVGKITGGKVDVLICNAYLSGTDAMMLPPSAFAGKEQDLDREINDTIKVNLLHTVYTINAFLPLVRNGQLKKIIYITSGFADPDFTLTAETPNLLGYCVSKAGMNMVIAKYAAELAPEGILTLSLSPGWVATDNAKEIVADQQAFQWMLSSFQKYDPKVEGMISTEASVKAQLSVINGLTKEQSGQFLSHFGNKNWL